MKLTDEQLSEIYLTTFALESREPLGINLRGAIALRAVADAAAQAEMGTLKKAHDDLSRRFKGFHSSLCDRFDYPHDDKFWWRDLVSLEEYIASKVQTAAKADARVRELKLELERLRNRKTVPEGYEVGLYGTTDMHGGEIFEEENFENVLDMYREYLLIDAEDGGDGSEVKLYAVLRRATPDSNGGEV